MCVCVSLNAIHQYSIDMSITASKAIAKQKDGSVLIRIMGGKNDAVDIFQVMVRIMSQATSPKYKGLNVCVYIRAITTIDKSPSISRNGQILPRSPLVGVVSAPHVCGPQAVRYRMEQESGRMR